MPPTETKAYTPGAERAITKICGSMYALTQTAIPAKLQHDFSCCVSECTHDVELLRVVKYFVEWVEDVWGSAAFGGIAKEEYEFAKALIAKVEGR